MSTNDTPKFTPGPWCVREAHDYHEGKVVGTELYVSVEPGQPGDDVAIAADITNPLSELIDETAWANARLIAAAPRLLEVLRGLVEAVVSCDEFDHETYAAEIRAADDALEAARGEAIP